MASFCLHLLLIMIFLASPLLSLPSSQPNPKASSSSSNTISASPASALSSNPQPTPSSAYQELSPDISPLLPKSGAVLPTPIGSSIPTIPSNLSPPNPDDLVASGPFSALAPFGSMPISSSPTINSVRSSNFAGFAALAAFGFIHLPRI
ncbi:classical arabinogalactan protein 26 [Ziziphus jujuba]|uniref:Classical arabinogalactan protein 26 n=2 Tax=Ziziphus jujuba TaxID=326968 RepID=A0A6P4BII4_ZIZJJ|nr:classical arabinogalactan protein 26 [Ziziphus jujuba]